MHDEAQVLLVDDDEASERGRRYLERQSERLSVLTESDRDGVLETLAARDVDCVVSECELSGSAELEIVEAVREAHSDIPIVLFTSRPPSEVASRGILAGADAYLRKETDPDQYELLANRIVNAVASRRTEPEREHTHEQYRTLIEHSSDLIVMVDGDGAIEYASHSVERVLGYDRVELVGESLSSFVHPDDRDRLADMRSAFAGGARAATDTVECRLERADGTHRWFEVLGTDRTDTPVDGYVLNARDVTERKARERELADEKAFVDSVLDALRDAFYIIDEDGRFVRWNDRIREVTGYTDAEIEALGPWEFIVPDERAEVADAMEAVVADERSVRVEADLLTEEGERAPHEFTGAPVYDADDEVVGIAGIGRDVAGRQQYEQALTALHATSRELLVAETRAEIADIVVSTAVDVLDADVVGVYYHDETENALVPGAITDEIDQVLADGAPTFAAGEGIAWEVFVSGESRVYDDVSRAANRYNPETRLGPEVIIPLGDHGVFICGAVSPEAFGDDRSLKLADLLAAGAEAALDRCEGDERLRERERELRERNERLARLDQINERVRKICHEIVGIDHRDDIYETVCQRLTAVEGLELAWVGERGGGEGIEPQAWSGANRGYLDGVSSSPSNAETPEPSLRALSDAEPVLVERVADDLHGADWAQEALTRDYRSILSLPLVHDGIQYGTLSLYACSTDLFDEETASVLETLAKTVANAVRSADKHQALVADRRVELAFTVRSGSPLTTVRREAGGSLDVDHVVQLSDSSLAYGVATGVDPVEFESTAENCHGVESVTVLDAERDEDRPDSGEDGDTATESPDRARGDGGGTDATDVEFPFELELAESPMIDAVVDHGGEFHGFSVDDGGGRLRMSFAASAQISRFIRHITDRFPGTELLARRDRDADYWSTTEDALTERQQEVIATAYHAGYYDWPRTRTCEGIAASLDISKPTFLEHLRRAEGKVVADFVGADATSRTDRDR